MAASLIFSSRDIELKGKWKVGGAFAILSSIICGTEAQQYSVFH